MYGRRNHACNAQAVADVDTAQRRASGIGTTFSRSHRQTGKKMERAECRACYRLRKQAMGFRQFLLRGLEKVEGEWALVTLACNCRRLHNLRIAANRT